ncbi:transporter [Sulfurovum sp. ST-21]|uniref:Transporter n=1 Tax=Sulfurovum indicum TaxID=2779528 RepID=A0A7M1S4A0_9BACT|nr:transporter [Sulfurovum indicum]QOR61821.1 transporter [Sulfurovum indicum]
MKKAVCLSLLAGTLAYAHHGVASLGVAGLEGPGAPLETTSSATLPEGKFLVYTRAEYISYTLDTPQIDGEMEKHEYFTYALGYGVTSYFDAYVFIPYFTKEEEGSVGTSGFHDIKFAGVLGFKYDDGLMLTPDNESLDDMEDWHFTTSFNVSIPTGDKAVKKPDGTLYDYGMQLSFGAPSFMVGLSATKWFGGDTTLVFDTSYNTFFKSSYSDGGTMKFGDEIRANSALSYKFYSNMQKKLRVDGTVEANFLHLGRDRENGVDQTATGGDILYTTVGLRLFYESVSATVGVKVPVWKDLNEEALQQGAEGNERTRLIFTFSSLF